MIFSIPKPTSLVGSNLRQFALLSEPSQAQEYSANCNQLLFDNHRWCNETMNRAHPMPHFFQDIMTLNLPGTFHALDGYSSKRQKISRSVLVADQKCNTHSFLESDSERCVVPGADFGCSGLPCTDMSKAGKRQFRHGPTNGVYMTHGKYVEAKQVPIFVLECTTETLTHLILAAYDSGLLFSGVLIDRSIEDII